jgi:hypothetical protein
MVLAGKNKIATRDGFAGVLMIYLAQICLAALYFAQRIG